MTNLRIEKHVAEKFYIEAKQKRDKLKKKLTSALNEYSETWYHKERVDYQKKNLKWKHDRIEDVKALNKIISESSTTTDLADKILDYIDGDNDHFWFAWFSPLRGYMRDAVESFTDKHDTKSIDHDLRLVSEKPPSQISSSSSPQIESSHSISDTESDGESHTVEQSDLQKEIDRLTTQLQRVNNQLTQKDRELESKASELSELKQRIDTDKAPQIQRLTQELETAKQQLKQKELELKQAKTTSAELTQTDGRRAAALNQAPPLNRALPAVASTLIPAVVTHNESDVILLKESLTQTQGKLNAVEREKEALLEKAKEFEAKIKASEEILAKLNTSEQEKQALLVQVSQLKAQTQELERLRSELAAASSKSEFLQAELNKVKSNTEILEQTHAKQIQDLESQLLDLDQQQLNQVLTTASKEFDGELEQKATQLEEQIAKLQQSRDELTKTKDLLSSALKAQTALQEKLDASNAENNRLKEENQTLKKENLTQGEKINTQSKQIELLQRIIAELKEKFTQFQSIATNVVDSLTTMFQSASTYFRKAIVDKKVTAKPAAKSKTSPESSTEGDVKDEKRRSGLGFGKTKGHKDSSSEETKKEAPKKKLFGSFGKKKGSAVVAKESIVVSLADLDGKLLRDAARKQIAAKQGDAYNLTVDSKVPGTSKTAEEIVGEFFQSDSALATAFDQADQLLASAIDDIVYDDTVERTLKRDIELEKDLLQAKSENDSLRKQIAEQLILLSKSKEAPTLPLNQMDNLAVDIGDLPPPPPPEFDEASAQSTLKEVERIRQLEQDLATEKEQTSILRAELDTIKSKALDTLRTVAATTISAEPPKGDSSSMIPLERFESLQAEFDQLKGQLEALKAANVSSSTPDESQSADNTAPPPPPPPPAAPGPPPPPGLKSTSTTPYRQSTTSNNASAFFAQPATEEKRPLSIAEEFALRQQNGASLRHVKVEDKPRNKPEESGNPIANALLLKFASLRKLQTEEAEAQNEDESDEDSGFDNN